MTELFIFWWRDLLGDYPYIWDLCKELQRTHASVVSHDILVARLTL